MLDKDKIKEMLERKEYDKICDYFYEKYEEILRDFLLSNGINIDEECVLVNYINIMNNKFPKYSGVMSILIDYVSNSKYDNATRINLMIDLYKLLKERLTVKRDVPF